MRCTAYCTADSYNIKALFALLKTQYATTLHRDTIHITSEVGNVFFFSYGVFVAWGFSEEEEYSFVEKIKTVEIDPYQKPERDEYDYSYGLSTFVQRDGFILTDKDVMIKRAISYALAQSVKLVIFETTIFKTIETTKRLPEDLARKGKIFLSRKSISQKIGQLFMDKSSVNLHSDILDEPDFFWEYPEHHPLYRDVFKCLDVGPRVEVLNTRLGIIGDLLEILSDQLNHQHSSILEWTIIWLIVIEVVLALLRDLFHII